MYAGQLLIRHTVGVSPSLEASWSASRESQSMATKPEEASATPTFALGHSAHHPSMTALSLVASLTPLVVNGALPDFSGPWPFQQAHEPSGLGQPSGITGHPRSANWRATDNGVSDLMGIAVLLGAVLVNPVC